MATQSNKEVFLGGFMNLFKQQWEVDVLLKAHDDDECASPPISAHKFVLAARSEVFKRMLESDKFKASVKLETITLSDMNIEQVEALVEFMYSIDGSISNDCLKKHVWSLYQAAHKYEILHLRDLCRNELISSLNSSNALNVLELSEIPLDELLSDAALSFITKNTEIILNSGQLRLFVTRNPSLAVEIANAITNMSTNPYESEDYIDEDYIGEDDPDEDEDEDDSDDSDDSDDDDDDDGAMATQSNLEIFSGGFAKVLNEQWQVDLRLKAGGSESGATISVHKLVLAARSEVFKKMLESEKLKDSVGNIETVTLSDLKQEELEALIEFIYNNGYKLSEKEKKHVQSLYIAANKYEIPQLKDLCRNELISALNLWNALNVVELSMIPFDKALHDSATIFIIRNLKTICSSVDHQFKLFVGRNPDLSVEIMKASLTRRWNDHYIF